MIDDKGRRALLLTLFQVKDGPAFLYTVCESEILTDQETERLTISDE